MANTILIKRSGTASAVPVAGDLTLGELSLNYTDGKLYFKNSGNVVTLLANANTVAATSLINGTSNVVVAASANVTISSAGTANVFTVTNTGIYTTGLSSVTGNITGGNILSSGLISTSGNIIGGGVRSTSSTTAPSNPTVGDFWYNTTTNVQYRFTFDGTSYYWIDDFGASVGTGGTFSAVINGTSTANIGTSNGNLAITINGTSIANFTTNGIENAQANSVGNIGNASNYFNTVFAKATSAQYADLAEKYLADQDYPPGTVVIFDGIAEVTQSTVDHDSRVAGIVSTNPSYVMNATLEGIAITVALTGRVPCRVQGPVTKGQILVSSTVPGTAMAIDTSKFQPGVVIGKSLETITDNNIQIIEVAVGRF